MGKVFGIEWSTDSILTSCEWLFRPEFEDDDDEVDLFFPNIDENTPRTLLPLFPFFPLLGDRFEFMPTPNGSSEDKLFVALVFITC